MDKDKTQIKMPNTDKIAIPIPDPGVLSSLLTPEQVKKDADSKFKDVHYILISVVAILIVMVLTLLIDSFHVNSATYKEYSQKKM